MKRLRAEVETDGSVSLDFIGFRGEQCTEERARLQEALKAVGVLLEPESIHKKSAQQIEAEAPASKPRPATDLG